MRLIRQVNVPLVCLLIAGMASLGCATKNSTWGEEEVMVPLPSHALVGDDGALVLGLEVQREQEPSDSGWHWITVPPEVAAVLMGVVPRDASDNLDYPVAVGWSHEWSEARMDPPLLEPGLPDQPPAGFDGFESDWRVVATQRRRVYRLVSVSDPQCTGPEFVFMPSFQREQTALRSISQSATELAVLPIQLGAAAVLVTCWLLQGAP